MDNQKFNSFLKDPRTNWKYILIVVILAVIVGGGILAYQYWQEQKIPYIPGEVIVSFIPEVSCTSDLALNLIQQNGGKVKEIISDDPIINVILVNVPVGEERAFIKKISKSEIVKYAKLNYRDIELLQQIPKK